MSEIGIGTLASASIVGLALGCFLYMLGGRSGKWKRRFVGSLVIATTVNACSYFMGNWSWHLILVYPALCIGFSLGYGADTLPLKILRRSIFALGVVGAGLVFCFTLGGKAWLVFTPHLGVALWTVFIGIKNTIHAAAEETFICLLLNAGLLIYPFVV